MTDRQRSRQTDRQTGRQTGRQADRKTDRQAGRQAGRGTGARGELPVQSTRSRDSFWHHARAVHTERRVMSRSGVSPRDVSGTQPTPPPSPSYSPSPSSSSSSTSVEDTQGATIGGTSRLSRRFKNFLARRWGTLPPSPVLSSRHGDVDASKQLSGLSMVCFFFFFFFLKKVSFTERSQRCHKCDIINYCWHDLRSTATEEHWI